MPTQNLFDEEKTEAKRIDTLIYGVLLDGSRKSWKTFAFEMQFRNGGYIKYSQTGSVKQRGKGKPKSKTNSSLQPSLQPDPNDTGVTEPPPPLPGLHPTLHPTSLQSTVGPAMTPRSITPTQPTEVLISQTLGLAGKYLEILDRGEKRVFEGPSPSPSCDIDFDSKVGDSAPNPRQLPKKKVCFKSSQVTRSALPEKLLRADIKQMDGIRPSISSESSDSQSESESDIPSSLPAQLAPTPRCVEGASAIADSADSAIAGEWTVVDRGGRGAKNRFRSPPATPATLVTGSRTGTTGVPGLSTAEILRSRSSVRVKSTAWPADWPAWPGGATFGRK